MKNILILLIFIFNLPLFAQTEKYVGSYEARYDSKDEVVERKLVLNLDGKFIFHAYSNLTNRIPSEENIFGKWTSKNNYIYFHVEENNLDKKHSLNFIGFKAGYKSKHPRDKSARTIIPSLIFYESNIFWAKGIKLFKKEKNEQQQYQ
mgnify:CR=1 FL=1